ncbi:hypothetical protein BDM02DRAFT_3114024 [Thelephora ganbajun]|uniref:Uncharacterized protein n=1 Tax=Thelephora ganbajun TaxID=370292 RepID=A0ACB6ZIH2_THEGA|nr:hypothetical protein BDM02DRAFT_3114024 [Thelephora ganbajun]
MVLAYRSVIYTCSNRPIRSVDGRRRRTALDSVDAASRPVWLVAFLFSGWVVVRLVKRSRVATVERLRSRLPVVRNSVRDLGRPMKCFFRC